MPRPDALPAFQRHPLAQSALAQTAWGACVGQAAPPLETAHGFSAVAVPTRDGGALEGRLAGGRSGIGALVLHGLGGDLRSVAVRGLGHRLAARGHTVLALAQRGSGGALERTTRPYMTGHTDDVADALGWLRRRREVALTVGIGMSLAGNTLLCLAGRAPREAPELTIAVAPPIDLERASARLARWPARGLELAVMARCRRWPPRFGGVRGAADHVGRLATLRDFDRDFIAPLWGFASRDAYYRAASAVHAASAIATPTWIVCADDDPLAPVEDVRAAPFGPSVQVVETRGGGHLGWIAAESRWRPFRWLDRVLPEVVEGARALGRPRPSLTRCAP